MHPDHALFYAGLGIALVLRTAQRRRVALRYGAPFVLVFVPYYLARWHYYGDFYPNTYYAKSGGQAYFTQGAVYLWVSGLSAGAVLVAPLALYGAFRVRHTVFGRFVLIAVPLYLAYVAKIGGDFMLGRLLCPMLPPWFLAAELGARDLFTRTRSRIPAYAGLFTLALAVLPPSVVKVREKYLNVADERTFYTLKTFSPFVVDCAYTEEAEALQAAFAHSPRPPRLGIGCIGIVGFDTDYPVMDNWGLTNRGVAHMEIRGRGRPGHEKLATPGFAFEGNADFSDIEIWPPDYDRWSKLRVRDFEFWLAKYDEALLGPARRVARVNVPDIERLARELKPAVNDAPRTACDAWFFRQLYFSQQDNPRLRELLTDKLVGADPSLAPVKALLLLKGDAPPPGWTEHVLFSFDTLAGFTHEGDAFEEGPATHDLRGQAHVYGQKGSYLSSLTSRALDTARGRISSSPFTLEGDALVLRVAGGKKPNEERVSLLIDGQPVASATGCESEVLGRRVWPTTALRGKQARLEVVDDSSDGWGHILVDEISEWRRLD